MAGAGAMRRLRCFWRDCISRKVWTFLADAMGMLKTLAPQLHVVVAGPDDGMQAEFEQRIKAHGVAERVHITGPNLRRG